MRDDDSSLRRVLAQWKIPEPPRSLADNVIARAMGSPQLLPWRELMAGAADMVAARLLRSAATTLATACIVAVLGFSAGYVNTAEDENDPAAEEMDAIIAGDMGWLEELDDPQT